MPLLLLLLLTRKEATLPPGAGGGGCGCGKPKGQVLVGALKALSIREKTVGVLGKVGIGIHLLPMPSDSPTLKRFTLKV
ncbi:hypothetical protein STEG23_018412 [Scotinomys teguina]